MNIIGKMCVMFVLTVLAIGIQGRPLYEEPKHTSAKVVNPDPLYAAASDQLPMLHSNDFDTIMPDYYDNHPAESMHFQNFEEFYEPRESADAEYKMDETQFVKGTPVRAPQPLSPEERSVREQVQETSVQLERQKQLKLKKGSTRPHQRSSQWDQFDYDMYSV